MKWTKKIDKKFSIGLIVGLIFGLLSVYVDFFRSSDPELTFNVLSNARVFDINENIGELDVLYDSTSLTKQGKTISLITIKIANTGNGSILKEHFASTSPLRIFINNSKIAQNPQVIETNESYLNESVSFNTISNNGFSINPFIFDKGKFFVIKILAVHQQNESPTIKVQGKIAKIDKFEILTSYNNQKTESFWSSVIHGNFLVHITRFFSYFFVIIVFVVLVALPVSLISNAISKRKRKNLIKIFRKTHTNSITDNHEILIDFYLENGIQPIIHFKRIINDQTKYRQIYSIVNEKNDFYFAKHKHHNPMNTSVGYLIRELKEKEVIKIEDRKFSIDESFKLFLIDFIKFMRE